MDSTNDRVMVTKGAEMCSKLYSSAQPAGEAGSGARTLRRAESSTASYCCGWSRASERLRRPRREQPACCWRWRRDGCKRLDSAAHVLGRRKATDRDAHPELTDVTAKVVIYETFVEGKLEAPKHLARAVHDLYFQPKYEEFRSRTIWSLSNAFTYAFKELDPIPQFKATAKLGEFLESRFSESF